MLHEIKCPKCQTVFTNFSKAILKMRNWRSSNQLRVRDEEIERMKDMKVKLNNKMIGESKGDFIFRNYDANGTEVVSIMFEMKNQIDDPIAKQKKNSDHFKKLDGDRAKKNCKLGAKVLAPTNNVLRIISTKLLSISTNPLTTY